MVTEMVKIFSIQRSFMLKLCTSIDNCRDRLYFLVKSADWSTWISFF